MGADQVIDVSSAPLSEDIELVFEASGAPAALGPVLRATAKGGTVVQVGNLPSSAASVVLGDLVTRELTWIGSHRFPHEIDQAPGALAAGLGADPLTAHDFDLEKAEAALRAGA